jgi:hypothetical protein
MKDLGVMSSSLFLLLAGSILWGEQKCTHIRVELNGRAVSAPREITLLSTRGKTHVVVPVEDDCFALPEKFQHSKSIDLVFEVEGNRIRLSALQPSAFSVGWNVRLKDNATTGPFAAFKNVPASEVCVVEFDSGKAEAQTHCRSAVRSPGAPPPRRMPRLLQ